MNTDKLQGSEKVVVWIANIINPVLAGFFFYYMWKKTFPTKAHQANKISFIVFGVEISIYFLYIFYLKEALSYLWIILLMKNPSNI